jgi:hypothetical protein
MGTYEIEVRRQTVDYITVTVEAEDAVAAISQAESVAATAEDTDWYSVDSDYTTLIDNVRKIG